MLSQYLLRVGLRAAKVLLAAVILLTYQTGAWSSEGCDSLHAYGCDCPGCEAYFDAVERGGLGTGAPGTGAPGTGAPGTGAPGTGELGAGELGAGDFGMGDMGMGGGLGQGPSFDSATGGSLLAASFGATAGAGGAVPSMIGDFFANNYRYGFTNQTNGTTVTTAGGDRRFKYAENTNPFPTDRVFFNYHFFEDPLLDLQGRSRDMNRFTFGIEKALCDGLCSVELRVPFANALNNVQDFAAPDAMASEFGNMALATKVLIHETDTFALAAGLSIIFPTGDDSIVANQGQTVIMFENGSLFLQPFVGIYHAPRERLFHQFLAQVDFDVTGSDVIIPANSPISIFYQRDEVSRLTSQTFLYLDYQVGYWLYRNQTTRFVSGVAPLLELHYNSALQNLDTGTFNEGIEGEPRNTFVEDYQSDVLNLTSGVYLELGGMTSLKLAAVTPLLDQRFFEYELGLQLVRRY